MKIVEDNSTSCAGLVNAGLLSPVDEEIDNMDEAFLEAKPKSGSKYSSSLMNDRRSFYDNHKWVNDEETVTTNQQSETNLVNGEKSAIGSSPKLYKSERSINLSATQKQERDEFDDLVDLTHRVPRKLLKKEATCVSNECLSAAAAAAAAASAAAASVAAQGVGRKCSSANKLSSSLPPLPPLPYSFVKLERSRAALSNPGSANSLNTCPQNHQMANTSNGGIITLNGCSKASLNQQPQYKPQQQCHQSTTRLIIPINKDYTLSSAASSNLVYSSSNNGVLKEQNATNNLTRANSAGYVLSTSSSSSSASNTPQHMMTSQPINHSHYHNHQQVQDEIDIVIYDQEFSNNTRSNSTNMKFYECSKENGANSRSFVRQQDVFYRGESYSPKPINVINDVERINIVVNGQQCTGTLSTGVSKSTKTLNEHHQQPQNQQTTGKNCAINNAVSRLKMEHRQQQHSKSRPADMNTEWDQISKIFASLETLLNEVVESTSKNHQKNPPISSSTIIQPSSSSSASSTTSNDSTSAAETNSTSSNCSSSSRHQEDETKTSPTKATNPENTKTQTTTTTTFTRRARNLLLLNASSGSSEVVTSSNAKMSNLQTTSNGGKLEISSNINNRKHLKHVEVGEFLKRIGLSRYELKFISSGYDDVNFLNDVITLQDLLQMGIEDYNDIFSVLSEVKKLPSSLKTIYDSRTGFGDVIKWLNFLNLSEYTEKFLTNNIKTMERVKKLWEIELITLVQIPLVGHRRRIMNSVEILIKIDRDKQILGDRVKPTKSTTTTVESEMDTCCEEEEDEKEVEVEKESGKISSSSHNNHQNNGSPPDLTKKLLNLNSLLSSSSSSSSSSASKTNLGTKTALTSNDESTSSSSSNGIVGVVNNPSQRRNCLSCRSTFSSNSNNSSSAAAPLSKSVKFNTDNNSSIKAQQQQNQSQSSISTPAIDSSEDQLSTSFSLTDFISKHHHPQPPQQQKKKKFDFHLSRFRSKRDSSSSSQNHNNSNSSNKSPSKVVMTAAAARNSGTMMSSATSSGVCVGGSSSTRSCDDESDSYICSGSARLCDVSSAGEEYRYPPKPIWKNDPQNLIKGSYNFIVYYLGSSAISRGKNNQDPVKATIDRLKNTAKSTPYQSPKVELSVSINGVKLLHYKTKEELCNYDIKHINNVCQDQDDLNYFAFSTQTEPNAHYYCHVFSCKDKDLSTQIILTIGQAFDIAYELFCKNNFN